MVFHWTVNYLIIFVFVFCKNTSAVNSSAIVASNLFGNGVNLQPSYYNNGDVSFAWNIMKKHDKIKALRIEVEPDKVSQAVNWIKEAHNNGYQVIVTYHKCAVLGSDDANELQAGAEWWVTNYATLSSSGPITINLMNEWGSHDLTSNAYAQAYQTAITTIRSVYNGYIIIDCPGWGQESTTAVNAVKSGVLYDTKIVLSMHIYPNGWNAGQNHNVQTSDIDDLMTANRPCIIGEFGDSGSVGHVDVPSVVTYAKSKSWAIFGWAWNGDGGTVMNMVTPSWAENATAATFTESAYFPFVYDLI